MRPWPMQPMEEKPVRDLYAVCHPDRAARPAEWYTAYPTLVTVVGEQVIGFTSFSVSPNPGGMITIYGNDLCVAPMWRNRGIGWELAEARMALGRQVGAKMFIGMTEPSNAGMIRIFERQHLHACQRVPGYFNGEDGIAWIGEL